MESKDSKKSEQIFGRVSPTLKKEFDNIDGKNLCEKLDTLMTVFKEYKQLPEDAIGINTHIRLIEKHLKDIANLLNVIQTTANSYQEDMFSDFEQQLEALNHKAESIDAITIENDELLEELRTKTKVSSQQAKEIEILKSKIAELEEEKNNLTADNYQLSKKLLTLTNNL